MPKLITMLTMTVEFVEEVDDADVNKIIDSGEIEERHFGQILPMLKKTAGFSEATLTGANVLMETVTGNFIRACPYCGKFETLVNDWCDTETCHDADCDLCEEKGVRIRCDGCGYRSPMYHESVEEAEEYWNTVSDALDSIDARSLNK